MKNYRVTMLDKSTKRSAFCSVTVTPENLVPLFQHGADKGDNEIKYIVTRTLDDPDLDFKEILDTNW